jgi:UDP-N-acetylmuramate: L-alanyl-gamma-D-glutamyl-meso-diaminopimelate ligase
MTAFRAGAAQVPRPGAVVVNAWSEGAMAASRDTAARVLRVGPLPAYELRMVRWQARGDTSVAEIEWRGAPLELEVPLAGEHNLQNAAMALAAALDLGVTADDALAALASFPGIARRLEVVGEAAGVTVVDDFAHHPTAIAATIGAARQRWPTRRLVVAFEPRSLTASRRTFEEAYQRALAEADLVLVAVPYHRSRLDEETLLDRTGLADRLAQRGVRSVMPLEDEDPVQRLVGELVAGDVVLGCSSGSFDDFHRRLLDALGCSS